MTDHDRPQMRPATHAQAMKAFFPDGEPTTNDTPLATAWLWYGAVVGRDIALARALSYRAEDWGDYQETCQDLDAYALMQFIEDSPEDPSIAYAKCLPNKLLPDPTYPAARATAGFRLKDARWITLVEQDGSWYVWGLSPLGYRPDARRVTHGV